MLDILQLPWLHFCLLCPEWPFPEIISAGPDYIDLNFPGVPGTFNDSRDSYELYSSHNNADFEFIGRYPVTPSSIVRRLKAMPNSKYQFAIRRRSNRYAQPSDISRPVTADTLPSKSQSVFRLSDQKGKPS